MIGRVAGGISKAFNGRSGRWLTGAAIGVGAMSALPRDVSPAMFDMVEEAAFGVSGVDENLLNVNLGMGALFPMPQVPAPKAIESLRTVRHSWRSFGSSVVQAGAFSDQGPSIHAYTDQDFIAARYNTENGYARAPYSTTGGRRYSASGGDMRVVGDKRGYNYVPDIINSAGQGRYSTNDVAGLTDGSMVFGMSSYR